MNKQRFASVWEAIEDTPQEAENMRLRSALMTGLKKHITRLQISQSEAAKLFGITQPRVSDLMRGKINLFSVDTLVNMATAAGLYIEVKIRQTPMLAANKGALCSTPLSIIERQAPIDEQGMAGHVAGEVG